VATVVQTATSLALSVPTLFLALETVIAMLLLNVFASKILPMVTGLVPSAKFATQTTAEPNAKSSVLNSTDKFATTTVLATPKVNATAQCLHAVVFVTLSGTELALTLVLSMVSGGLTATTLASVSTEIVPKVKTVMVLVSATLAGPESTATILVLVGLPILAPATANVFNQLALVLVTLVTRLQTALSLVLFPIALVTYLLPRYFWQWRMSLSTWFRWTWL
jgi:Alphavirus glycoprotein J